MRLFNASTSRSRISMEEVREVLESETDIPEQDLRDLLFSIYNSILFMYLRAIESIEDQMAVWRSIDKQSIIRRTIQELPLVRFHRHGMLQNLTLVEQVTHRPYAALHELSEMRNVYMKVLGHLLHWHRRVSHDFPKARSSSPSTPTSPSPTSASNPNGRSTPDIDVGPAARELYECLAHTAPLPRTGKQDVRPEKILALLTTHTLRTHPSMGAPPGYLTRSWVPFAAYTFAFYIGLKVWRGYNLTEVIKQMSTDVYYASVNFVRTRILVPARAIYATIRYDQSSLNLLPAQSLEAEESSLIRMVTDYGKERLGLQGAALESLKEQITQGDLTLVLREFEKDIRTPISSFFFGDVLRMAIIQVQKSKVDVNRAMLVLDKLMQSNELTFHMISLIPALFVAHYTLRSVLAALGLVKWGLYSSHVREKVREMVLELARVINHNSVEVEEGHEDEEWIGEGRLMILAHRIAMLVRGSREFDEEAFLDDLNEVIMFGRRGVGIQNNSPFVISQQRLSVIDRMFKAHRL